MLPIIKRNREIKHLKPIISNARDAICQTITEDREFPNRPFASFVTKFETTLEKSTSLTYLQIEELQNAFYTLSHDAKYDENFDIACHDYADIFKKLEEIKWLKLPKRDIYP